MPVPFEDSNLHPHRREIDDIHQVFGRLDELAHGQVRMYDHAAHGTLHRQSQRLLLIGAGEMIELTATHFAARHPKSITIAGRTVAWQPALVAASATNAWAWDGATAEVRIRLARVDLRRGATVTIDGAVAAPDGLPALLRRLEQLMTWTKAHSPCHAIHAEERLPIGLAQTGHRIARKPQTASRELGALRAGLGRLDGILAIHAKAFPQSEWPQARRLLALLRRDFPAWFTRAS